MKEKIELSISDLPQEIQRQILDLLRKGFELIQLMLFKAWSRPP